MYRGNIFLPIQGGTQALEQINTQDKRTKEAVSFFRPLNIFNNAACMDQARYRVYNNFWDLIHCRPAFDLRKFFNLSAAVKQGG
jgi:hypothetical protein